MYLQSTAQKFSLLRMKWRREREGVCRYNLYWHGIVFSAKIVQFLPGTNRQRRRNALSIRYWWYILMQEDNCLDNRKKTSEKYSKNESVFSCKWCLFSNTWSPFWQATLKPRRKKERKKQLKESKYVATQVCFQNWSSHHVFSESFN